MKLFLFGDDWNDNEHRNVGFSASDTCFLPLSSQQEGSAEYQGKRLGDQEGDEDAVELGGCVSGKDRGQWNFDDPEADEVKVRGRDRVSCTVERLQKDGGKGRGKSFHDKRYAAPSRRSE